jgi:DNA polymerase-4
MLGRASGRHLHALAHNRDPRPVHRRRRRRSIGAQRALGRRPRGDEELAEVLMVLIDRVTRRLRAADRACRTVVLRLRFGDYTRVTRSHTLPLPTTQTPILLGVAGDLLRRSMPLARERGLTLVGVALTNLTDPGSAQLTLPFDRAPELDTAVDAIRDRFGTAAITRGALVGRDPGPWVPLLPDD